ncbi:MAG: signal peptidase I [Coriobacteriia bacterium]|nr:signal peptidase I [Coriobacteriia bacterium]
MPNSSADGWHAWLRRLTGTLLALVIVALGWSHGVLYVEGGSMQPSLFPGDLIVYRRIGHQPVRGDLVVFRHDGALVVHRVVRVDDDGSLTMRGDANQSSDTAPVDADDVRGTVLAVLPAGRAAALLVSAAD